MGTGKVGIGYTHICVLRLKACYQWVEARFELAMSGSFLVLSIEVDN